MEYSAAKENKTDLYEQTWDYIPVKKNEAKTLHYKLPFVYKRQIQRKFVKKYIKILITTVTLEEEMALGGNIVVESFALCTFLHRLHLLSKGSATSLN